MTQSQKIRDYFKANSTATVQEAMKEFPTAHSSNIYKLRSQVLGGYWSKRKPKKVAPGVAVVRKVINEQTNKEEDLLARIASLKEDLARVSEAFHKSRDEVKGYQVLTSYFEWQIGLRDSQAGHRGSPV